MPERIQLKRTRGWRMPEGAVKVDRTTIWGNPFKVREPIARGSALWPYVARIVPGGVGDMASLSLLRAEDAVACYSWWIIEQPSLMLRMADDLGGRDLACWCPAGAACHADDLLELVAELTRTPDPEPYWES